MKIHNKSVTKANKTAARNKFNDGFKVYVIPCKMSPISVWMSPQVLSLVDNDPKCNHLEILDFDKQVNAYEYYNCQHNETGKYCAYYVEDNHRFENVRSLVIPDTVEIEITESLGAISVDAYYFTGGDFDRLIYEIDLLATLANVSQEVALYHLSTGW